LGWSDAMAKNGVEVVLRLGEDDAWALAQFVKRIGWSEFRALAVDDEEAHRIRSGVDALQRALAEAGVAPR
jgi:dissimilatory sulfite reductase (desulfoviridin) alpha/beta subunit